MTTVLTHQNAPKPAFRWGRGHTVLLILALSAWCGVAVIEWFSIRNDWLATVLVAPVELSLWLFAAVLTVYLARVRFLPAALTRGVAAVVLALLVVQFNNWSTFEPRSYYVTHQASFDRAAKWIDAGHVRGSSASDRLPRYLADLSTDGRASKIAEQDGKPVVFLAQWFGIPDDAGGYVYFDGTPRPDLQFDLFGCPATLAGGISLGNGWWYVSC